MFDSLFGNGKMEIELSRHRFGAGEMIEGSVSFKLDEPLAARALIVGLRAKQRVRSRRMQNGQMTSSEETRTVYEFKNELSGERTYSSGTKAFALTVPQDALKYETQAPDGIIGDIARAASFFAGESRSPVEWEVFGLIDIPWKVNVKKSVAITVVEGAPAPPPGPRIRIG